MSRVKIGVTKHARHRKIIKAGEREIYSNPRSRSAKLRVAERIENNLEYAV